MRTRLKTPALETPLQSSLVSIERLSIELDGVTNGIHDITNRSISKPENSLSFLRREKRLCISTIPGFKSLITENMDNAQANWKNARGVEVALYQGTKLPRIIAISGKYGSGKDTVCREIAWRLKALGYENQSTELKFAGALKTASAAMSGTTVPENYSDVGKAKMIRGLDMTVGRLQQVLGTMARLHIHPDIWVIPVIEACNSKPELFCIISDCRFINEATKIQELGGLVVRLNRDPKLISEISTAGRDCNHISETCLDDYDKFDLVYQNDGTLQELLETILKFLRLDSSSN